MNGSVMNVVSYEQVCYECSLLLTWSVMNESVMNRSVRNESFRNRSVKNRSVRNVVCYEWFLMNRSVLKGNHILQLSSL